MPDVQVTLPAAVQRQLEIADQIERELLQPAQADTGTPPDGTAQPAQTPAPAAQVAPVTPESQPAAPVTPAPDTATQPDVTAELQRERQRYHTLQSKYNAEVPRLIEQTRQLQASLDTLMQQRDAEKKAAEAAPLTTEQDTEKFGADLMDVISRRAQDEMRAERAAWAQREAQFQEMVRGLQQTVTQLQQGQGTLSEQAFFAQLDRALPGWEKTNTNPQFLAWLQSADPMSGMPRQAILDMHVQNKDVARTANIFSLFAGETTSAGAVTPKPLTQQVTPSNAGGSAPTVPNTQQKVWSGEEVAKAYDDIRRGRYSDKEAQALIDDIDRAAVEGRIT